MVAALFDFPGPGEAFEGYDILEQIGEGSFSNVYRALAPGDARPVALKIIALPQMSPDMVQRALREIAVLRSLTNPHAVRLYGSGIGEGWCFISMEFLEGHQLDQWHSFGEPMAVATALDVILQASMGLAELHARGVVHRDVKPANLWHQHDGTIKVLDFGLSRAWGVPWAWGSNATTQRTVVGTPHYCQPEQLTTHELTPASDIYSLATILYELLSGYAALFEHQTVPEVIEALHDDPMGWLDAHAMRDTVPITRYPGCGGLPETLLTLLSKSLDKEPSKRPQKAGIFACALGDILVDDLQAVDPLRLRVEGPGRSGEQTVGPGRRRIGAGEFCDVVVAGGEVADVHVLLDWSGGTRPVQVRTTAKDHRARLDDADLEQVAPWLPGDVLEIGSCRVTLEP